jgi:hypothetical protein
MHDTTAHVGTLTPEDLDDRRLAVEGTVGTMRLSDLEPVETTMRILDSYQRGEITIEELNRLMHEYSSMIG